MRKRLVALVSAALFLSACGSDLLEPAAATVNGQKITIKEVEEAVAEYTQSQVYKDAALRGDRPELREAYEREYLESQILRGVLEPEAEERGLEVTDETVAQEIEKIKADFASQAAFEEALKEQGLTLEQLESLVYDRQLEELVKKDVTADLQPTDAEIRSFYQENAERYIETDVSHIVLESQSEAKAVAKRLQKVAPGKLESEFAKAAREESIYNETAASGGDLGYLTAGQADPTFEEAAANVEIGSVSDPVQTELGWEVLLVKDRRPIPLEEVRDEIVTTIAGEDIDAAWNEWLTEAYEEAEIEINPRYGVLEPGSIEITDPDLPGTSDVTPTQAPAGDPAETPAG